VKRIELLESTPLVVAATHDGESNFIVELIPGSTGLFNEFGRFSGQTAVSDIEADNYRVKIQADGNWTLKLTQPVPKPSDKDLIGTFTGKGAKVIQVQATSTVQPTVKGPTGGSPISSLSSSALGTSPARPAYSTRSAGSAARLSSTRSCRPVAIFSMCRLTVHGPCRSLSRRQRRTRR